jgi:hypothetical protein
MADPTEKGITALGFLRWLKRSRQTNFSRASCTKCALARYLGAGGNVGWREYRSDKIRERPLPTWAQTFVERFTCSGGGTIVSRKRAIQIMQEIVNG